MEKQVLNFDTVILGGGPAGLSAAIYTQLSDVEDELNGLVTYDRKICKLPPEKVKEIVAIN